MLIQSLMQQTGFSKEYLYEIIDMAPFRYKVFTIPKKRFGRRVIAQPTADLKKIQRVLVNLLASSLPISQNAFAYQKSIGIKDNALYHLYSHYLVKMDIYDFFNSITVDIFWEKADKYLDNKFSVEEKKIIQNILFWNPSKKIGGKLILSVGAPSSPFISNFILYQFDQALSENCMKLKINYSRYADDLTFTSNSNENIKHIPNIVKNILKNEFQGRLVIRNSKTVFSSKRNNRKITGITLTNDNKLSIGRKNKRILYSLVYNCINNKLEEDDINVLRGKINFASYINPQFKIQLIQKYGFETLKTFNLIR